MNFPRTIILLALALAVGVSVPAVKAQEAGIPSLDPAPHAKRAVAAMRDEDWKKARSAWETVIRLDPANVGALSNLGKVQFQLGDAEGARVSLEKATVLKPDLIDSWLTLGQVYMELKAPMMAVSATTRAVAENPADPRSHNALAIVLKGIGWTVGAEAELQKALDLDPEYAEAHFNLAVMYLERKPPSLEMAGRHYRKARSLGAVPDQVVEKQIQGESTFEEAPEDAGDETDGPAGTASHRNSRPNGGKSSAAPAKKTPPPSRNSSPS